MSAAMFGGKRTFVVAAADVHNGGRGGGGYSAKRLALYGHRWDWSARCQYLVGLVVKASASRAGGPGFESR